MPAHDDTVLRSFQNQQGGRPMSVVLIHQGPSFTRERYEEIVRRLTGGKTSLESPSDWPVESLLAHVAGDSPQGFRVVDVWQSEEACNRFGDAALGPILQEVGVDDRPGLMRRIRLLRREACHLTKHRSSFRGSRTEHGAAV